MSDVPIEHEQPEVQPISVPPSSSPNGIRFCFSVLCFGKKIIYLFIQIFNRIFFSFKFAIFVFAPTLAIVFPLNSAVPEIRLFFVG